MSEQLSLRIFRRESPVEVLGPGRRAVIWVQGCAFRCPGCIVPESWDSAGGEMHSLAEMAAWVLAQSDIGGLTLSGGEPFQQAGALAELVRLLRAERDLSVLSYSGYRHEELLSYGTAAQRELLGQLDLLIDGPYIASRQGDLLWRGSSNQRIIALSGRHRGFVEGLQQSEDRGAGLSFRLDEEGLSFSGVPTEGDFRERLELGLLELGVFIRGSEGR